MIGAKSSTPEAGTARQQMGQPQLTTAETAKQAEPLLPADCLSFLPCRSTLRSASLVATRNDFDQENRRW